MTREKLQKIYDKEYAQAGDTDEIFMDWAIDYLLSKNNDYVRRLANYEHIDE